MPWVRIDEHFADHPKVQQAGPLALALHVAALCYCNRFLTDGFVPEAKAKTLLDVPDPDATVRALVSVGLWEKAASGYQIHDYLDYQPSKQSVTSERAKKKAAGEAGGKASAQARSQAGASAGTSASGQSESNPGSGSVPDTEPESSKPSPRPADDGPAFDAFWKAYPTRNGVKGSRKKALAVWKAMGVPKRRKAFDSLELYGRASNGYPKDAERYLRDEMWEGVEEPKGGSSNGHRPFVSASEAEYAGRIQ